LKIRTDADQCRATGIWPARPMTPFEPMPPQRSPYVPRSLVRAAAFRVMRRAPLWVAIVVLAAGCIMEHVR
jgi:hypothetical protein